MNKKLITFLSCLFLATINLAEATGIDKNTAKMQAMDKITGRVSVIYVPVGGLVTFGSLSIVVRSCKTRPMEEAPDNFAFADISDKTLKGEDVNIFRGWMISSSPATHAVEHPIYDVWLLSCVDKKVDKNLLLSEEALTIHENLPKQNQAKDGDTAAESNSRPIAEMQEENAPKQQAPQPTEFSYDEADEADILPEEDTENAEAAEGEINAETTDATDATDATAIEQEATENHEDIPEFHEDVPAESQF